MVRRLAWLGATGRLTGAADMTGPQSATWKGLQLAECTGVLWWDAAMVPMNDRVSSCKHARRQDV
jgi:hypothetical protein